MRSIAATRNMDGLSPTVKHDKESGVNPFGMKRAKPDKPEPAAAPDSMDKKYTLAVISKLRKITFPKAKPHIAIVLALSWGSMAIFDNLGVFDKVYDSETLISAMEAGLYPADFLLQRNAAIIFNADPKAGSSDV